MRIEGWKAGEVFKGFIDKAESNAVGVMDEVCVKAKQKLATSVQYPPIVREGDFGKADVYFIPKTGRNKGKVVSFHTDKRWTGRRTPDNLFDSIRVVTKPGSGSVRVYAGNFKVYWSFMIEKSGYTDRSGKKHPPIHFLQHPFHSMKNSIVKRIAGGL
jgi:hypothetical protein